MRPEIACAAREVAWRAPAYPLLPCRGTWKFLFDRPTQPQLRTLPTLVSLLSFTIAELMRCRVVAYRLSLHNSMKLVRIGPSLPPSSFFSFKPRRTALYFTYLQRKAGREAGRSALWSGRGW